MRDEGVRRLAFHFRRLSLRREVIYLTRALAEACLLTPWLTGLAALYRPVRMVSVTSAVFGIILGASYLARATQALGVSARRQRAAAAAAMLFTSVWVLYGLGLVPRGRPDWPWLLSILRGLFDPWNLLPPSLAVVLGVVFVWWRGLRLALKSFSVLDVSIGFQIGVLLFAVFVVLSPAPTQAEVNPHIVAFFFCQLLAIGLTRVETIGDQPGGRRSPFGRWWVAALALSTGLVLLAAGAVYGLVMGAGPEHILDVIAPVMAIILIPFALIIGPLLELIGPLLEPLLIALLSMATTLGELFSQLRPTTGPAPAAPPDSRAPFVEIALQAMGCSKGLLVLALSLLIIVSIIWAIHRAQAQHGAAEDEERESVWSSRQWIARLRRRVRQRFEHLTGAAGLLTRFGLGGLFTALTIRRIYAQLQKLAARRGYPREPARTPYEYLPTLVECFPSCQADLARITEAYVGVHYGELPEQPEELASIRAAWERIQVESEEHRPHRTY